jgi:diguanylate cyclase (GGDEF)-like protein
MKKQRWYLPNKRRWRYAIFGIFLSVIGPLGEWFFLKTVARFFADTALLSFFYTEIASLIVFSVFGFIIGGYVDKLENLAFRDKLTGLYNRHYLMNRLAEIGKLSKRYEERSSLMMLDLDHFKKVNDTYGHMVGDETLRAVAKQVVGTLRETDIASRYGGEEFIVICPHTSIHECEKLAERIRLAVSQIEENDLGYSGSQTVSAGVFEIPPAHNLTIDQILNYLDQALYRAKQEGRNRVAVYEL